MGRIAAGRGHEAVALDEAYSLATELIAARSGRQRYLLRIVGQSMVGARIGDGAVIVALLRDGEEVTVTGPYREEGKVRLRPENGDHEELVFPAEDVRIQASVVYVMYPPRGRGGA